MLVLLKWASLLNVCSWCEIMAKTKKYKCRINCVGLFFVLVCCIVFSNVLILVHIVIYPCSYVVTAGFYVQSMPFCS